MSKVSGRDILLGVLTFSMLCVVIKIVTGSTSVAGLAGITGKQGPEGPPGPQGPQGPPAPLGATGIPGLSPYIVTGPVANSLKINEPGGLYYYNPLVYNFWNSGNGANSAQLEAWVPNTATGIGNIGSVNYTGGIISNLSPGVYKITLSGAYYVSNATLYPQLQYKPNGGSFSTVAQTAIAFPNGVFCPVSLDVILKISNVNDSIRLYYNTGGVYGNTGVLPQIYTINGNNNYLNRYLNITFISL
jgi:hypothetical protein